MTVFKTFLKVLTKYKTPVIMYTVFLIFFGGFNMQTSESSTNFVASRPDILIINNDEEIGITKDLIKYIKDNSNIIDKKVPDYLDKNWYINLAKDRVDSFVNDNSFTLFDYLENLQ